MRVQGGGGGREAEEGAGRRMGMRKEPEKKEITKGKKREKKWEIKRRIIELRE